MVDLTSRNWVGLCIFPVFGRICLISIRFLNRIFGIGFAGIRAIRIFRSAWFFRSFWFFRSIRIFRSAWFFRCLWSFRSVRLFWSFWFFRFFWFFWSLWNFWILRGFRSFWFFRCLWSFFISRIVRYGWCLRNIRCLCQAFSCLRIHFLTSRGIFQIAGFIIQPDCSSFHHSPYIIRYTHKYFRSICLFCLHCILCYNGRFSIIGKYRHWRTKSHSKCQKTCQCLCPDPF